MRDQEAESRELLSQVFELHSTQWCQPGSKSMTRGIPSPLRASAASTAACTSDIRACESTNKGRCFVHMEAILVYQTKSCLKLLVVVSLVTRRSQGYLTINPHVCVTGGEQITVRDGNRALFLVGHLWPILTHRRLGGMKAKSNMSRLLIDIHLFSISLFLTCVSSHLSSSCS